MSQNSSDPVPVSNRPETVLGSSITIQIIAIAAVCFRLHARCKLRHGYGFDDLFVILACCSTLAGTIFVDLQPSVGLGRHQKTLTLHEIERYLFYTYGSVCTYASSTTLIKVSVLFQYLRLSDKRLHAFRRICVFMLGLVTIWGLTYFFMIIFSCNPVSGYWEVLKPASCYFFGSRDDNVKVSSYISQAASNMILDVIVFLLPLYLLHNLNLTKRAKWGLIGVFSLGFLAVMTSLLRLTSMVNHRMGISPQDYDTTWYTPITIIWTCIEVNVAVIGASIPIFWPMIEQMAFGKIFVTDEVVVNSEPRRSRTIESGATDEQELALNLSWQDATSKAAVCTAN